MKYGKQSVRLRSSTPKKISERIAEFLRQAGLNRTDARYLRFTMTSSDYKPRYCLNNCEAESRQSGTQVVYGWMIWEDRRYEFIEAEFHAVIRRDGTLIDITPRVDGEERILFVPDPTRTPTRVGASSWRTWTNIESHRGRISKRPRRSVHMDPDGLATQGDGPNGP